MRLRVLTLFGLVVAGVPALAGGPDAPALRTDDGLLLGSRYPIEAEASFPAGLFHWVDSLAGTSAGKTIPGHRQDFTNRFGGVTREDRKQLEAFVEARADHVRRLRDGKIQAPGVPFVSALLGVFCAASTVEGALERARPELSSEAYEALRGSLAHFRPKYESIWRGGELPKAFLARARSDSARPKLAELLERIARFFGVDPRSAPPSRISLVPVPGGYGTHAEAMGRELLIEIRDGEGLADEASVIVHENAHFLFERIPKERRERLAASLRVHEPDGERAWNLLHEALPTALGQGLADQQFRPASWSTESPWYHTTEVDAYAKALYPFVNYALGHDLPFDAAFLEGALARLPDSGAAGRPGVTPRSP